MHKTVVIPAAGLGSRLDEFTKNYNKAMCTLGPKPVISYIIEKFTKEDEIIVLLGYKGDLLKQVIKIAYPDWNIKFVNVDKFEGEGSGLGYSLSCAKDLLQKPFLFWSNDSVIDDDVNKWDYSSDFMILSEFRPALADQYRHASIGNGKVNRILPKGEYDPKGKSTLPYIGISFIHDFKTFWNVFETQRDIFIAAGESAGLNAILPTKYYVTKSWLDTGNKAELIAAKKKYSDLMEETILEKPEEAIWFFDDVVVKFHIDPKFITGRVERFKTFVNADMKKAGVRLPDLLAWDKNVYSYRRAPGHIMSKRVTPTNFQLFLTNFIGKIEEKHVSSEYRQAMVNDFYRDKTLSRIKKYCETYEDLDEACTINGYPCYPAKEMISSINWDLIADKIIVTDNYHGDFHLENVLINKTSEGKDEYIMLDWRQNFGKTQDGDIYYDLAKMWHSLIVNHNFVKEGRFEIKIKKDGEIIIDINRSFIDTECEEALKRWFLHPFSWYDSACNTSRVLQFDMHFAQFLTALIFLNIAACHTGDYSRFLFHLGKYLMSRFLDEHHEYIKKN